MENQFIEWEDWEQVDTAAFLFYKCTLKVDVEDLKAGTFFDAVFFDYEKGVISFQQILDKDKTVSYTYKLKFKIEK